MIQATLTKVLFARDMRTGQVVTDAVVFELEDGTEAFANPTPALLGYIERNSVTNGQKEAGYERPFRNETVRDMPAGAPAHADEEEEDVPPARDPHEEVEWQQLPEDVLGTHYKVAMMSLGNIKPVLTWQLLEQMVDAIDREFTEEMWAQVGYGSPAPAAEAAPSETSGGFPVDVDVAGNPVVPTVDDPDPGERVADDDEDDEDANQF